MTEKGNVRVSRPTLCTAEPQLFVADINTSCTFFTEKLARGGLVVDDDLIVALKSGRVAAAGLDVFEGEPKLNPEYVPLKNTFLLPHIGSATIETRTAMGMLALDNVDAVLNGRPAPTLVQP